jgi:hypothetical protein
MTNDQLDRLKPPLTSTDWYDLVSQARRANELADLVLRNTSIPTSSIYGTSPTNLIRRWTIDQAKANTRIAALRSTIVEMNSKLATFIRTTSLFFGPKMLAELEAVVRAGEVALGEECENKEE